MKNTRTLIEDLGVSSQGMPKSHIFFNTDGSDETCLMICAHNTIYKLARILHFLHPILIIRQLALIILHPILHPSCTQVAPKAQLKYKIVKRNYLSFSIVRGERKILTFFLVVIARVNLNKGNADSSFCSFFPYPMFVASTAQFMVPLL